MPAQTYQSSASHRRPVDKELGKCSRYDCTLPPLRGLHPVSHTRRCALSIHPVHTAWLHESVLWLQARSEEHTSELQSQSNLVCRLLLEKKKNIDIVVHSRNLLWFLRYNT